MKFHIAIENFKIDVLGGKEEKRQRVYAAHPDEEYLKIMILRAQKRVRKAFQEELQITFTSASEGDKITLEGYLPSVFHRQTMDAWEVYYYKYFKFKNKKQDVINFLDRKK